MKGISSCLQWCEVGVRAGMPGRMPAGLWLRGEQGNSAFPVPRLSCSCYRANERQEQESPHVEHSIGILGCVKKKRTPKDRAISSFIRQQADCSDYWEEVEGVRSIVNMTFIITRLFIRLL